MENLLNLKNIVLAIILLSMFSCKKEDLVWNLEKNNSFDIDNNKPCSVINCEDLSIVTTYVDKISPSSSAAWDIGLGYSGNGYSLDESCYGGYIEFSNSNSSLSKMTFWTKSLNLGFPNRIPIVTIDGVVISTSIIEGSSDYSNWMRLETPVFQPGNHIIRINFDRISTYYSYYIDEIEFWCK